MNFITTHAPPVALQIDGQDYKVPRFLLPAFTEYVQEFRDANMKAALAELQDEDRRARFRLYHPNPAVDVNLVAQELTAPEGLKKVIRYCFGKAGVPAASIEGFIENVDPQLQRNLVDELRSGNGMIAEQLAASGDPGAAGNPTTGQPPTSGDSPTITEATGPMSSDSSPASNPTA